MSTLTFIGAGPKTLGVLLGIAAEARAGKLSTHLGKVVELATANLSEADARVVGSSQKTGEGFVIHLIDPFPHGGGRIWRNHQDPVLWMNSLAADITVFRDPLTAADIAAGHTPPIAGPNLAEWIATHHPESGIGPRDFAPRTLCAEYLYWVLDLVERELAPYATIHRHTGRATAVEPRTASGGYRVNWQKAAEFAPVRGPVYSIDTDVLVMSVGFIEVEPGPAVAWFVDQARTHGLTYVPPGYTADLDLSVFTPGQHVITRGMGLAFIDALMMMTESRGGTYQRDVNGVMTYTPSGQEPILWVGSRKAVAYKPKLGYEIDGVGFEPLRYLTEDNMVAIRDREGRVDVRKHLGPLLEAEVMQRHYRELVERAERTGHTRVVGAGAGEMGAVAGSGAGMEPGDKGEGGNTSFAQIKAQFSWRIDALAAAVVAGDVAGVAHARTQLDEFVAATVPHEADRYSMTDLERPLSGMRFNSHAQVEKQVAEHIAADLERAASEYYSQDLAAFFGLVGGYLRMRDFVVRGFVAPEDRVANIQGWLHGFFSSIASGPPPERLENLLAAHRAGIVRFLGPDTRVEVAEGQFVARSQAVAGGAELVRADALFDAFLAPISARLAKDPLLRSMQENGLLTTESSASHERFALGAKFVADAAGHARGADGQSREDLFLLGPSVAGAVEEAFARPGTGSPVFTNEAQLAASIVWQLAAAPGVWKSGEVRGRSWAERESDALNTHYKSRMQTNMSELVTHAQSH